MLTCCSSLFFCCLTYCTTADDIFCQLSCAHVRNEAVSVLRAGTRSGRTRAPMCKCRSPTTPCPSVNRLRWTPAGTALSNANIRFVCRFCLLTVLIDVGCVQCSCGAWDNNPIVTLDLTDHNLWHFMNEVMLPTWHSLINVDLIPAHVKRCAGQTSPRLGLARHPALRRAAGIRVLQVARR